MLFNGFRATTDAGGYGSRLKAGTTKIIPATRRARGLQIVPPKERAWGMPGAQCTRSLVCESGGWNAHEYSQRVHRKTPGIPTQWFTAYTALSLATGLSCHHRRRITPPT